MFNAEYHVTKTYDSKAGAIIGLITNAFKGFKPNGSKLNEDNKIEVSYVQKFKIKI